VAAEELVTPERAIPTRIVYRRRRVASDVERSCPMAKKESSVYRVTEIIGTSPKSWEEAARDAIETAAKSLRDLRVAEVTKLDMKIEDGKVVAYRARVSLSFKYDA
jgi:flavin-binding protein dodecin